MHTATEPATQRVPVSYHAHHKRFSSGHCVLRSFALILCAGWITFERSGLAATPEYRVVTLQTGSSTYSTARAISGGRVAGTADLPFNHAVEWNDAGAPLTDLNPPGTSISNAEDIDGTRVVGVGGLGTAHALLWPGSGKSFVDLHPRTLYFSEAYGIRGSQVVGRGGRSVGGDITAVHALMWPDALPDRVVDLNPDGYEGSGAFATTGDRQGGYGILNGGHGVPRALLWSSTADSFVDVTPGWSDGGFILAMSGEQQVGILRVKPPEESLQQHAALWSGTAASAIDLHPVGFTTSSAEDTNERQQVGYGVGIASGGKSHALLWNGDNVVLDLHRFLPADAVGSYAGGIDDDGTVVGSASFAGGVSRAVMWVPVPEPTGCALVLLPSLFLVRVKRRRILRRQEGT